MFRATCLTAGLAFAALVATTGPASAKDATNTHEMIARVVAVDLAAKSIRIEGGTGSSQVLFVVGKAAGNLDQLPIGRMFKLTLEDDDGSARQVVIAIKAAKNAPKT